MKICSKVCVFIALIVAVDIFQQVSGCVQLTAQSYESVIYSHYEYGSENYDDHVDQCWVITSSSSDKVVKLSSSAFNTVFSINCDSDYVTLHDSAMASGDHITYCGYDGSFSIYSSGNSIHVRFSSDGDDNTAAGFTIQYSEVDSSNYDASLWTNSVNHFSPDIGAIIFLSIYGIVGLGFGAFFFIVCISSIVGACYIIGSSFCESGDKNKGKVCPDEPTAEPVSKEKAVIQMENENMISVKPPLPDEDPKVHQLSTTDASGTFQQPGEQYPVSPPPKYDDVKY